MLFAQFPLFSTRLALFCIVGVGSLGGLSACDRQESLTSKQQKDAPALSGNADHFTSRFSWVRGQELSGMPLPGYRSGARIDAETKGQNLHDDLDFLQQQGIKLLFSLTESSLDKEIALEHGIELRHLPVKDFTAPSKKQLLDFIVDTQQAIEHNRPVGVHCFGGHGRSGTFLAAWFIHEGMSAEEALVEIRRLRPGSVETVTQEQALGELETFLQQQQGWDSTP